MKLSLLCLVVGTLVVCAAAPVGCSFYKGSASQAVSTSQSTITVSAGTVASGGTLTLTLQAKDANGNNLTTGGLTVVFTVSGGTSTGTIGATTDHGDGIYTAVFSAARAGTAWTVQATINGAAVTSTLPTISITPGAVSASQSTVSVSAGTVASGGTLTLMLQAKDSSGNDLTTGGLTVVFTVSGGTGTGTIGATSDNANGTYTATFTAGTPGTAMTIGATIGGTVVTSTLPTIIVTPGAVSTSQSTMSVSAGTVASGGTVTLTLQAKDASGTNLTAGGLTVVFATSGGTSSGTIGTTTDSANGRYVATFAAVTAGTATTVHATIGGTAVTSIAPTITVVPGAASQLVFTMQPVGTAPGSSFGVSVAARDAQGNTATGFSGNVGLAITVGTGRTGAHLLGTTTIPAVAGVATFGGLSIDSVGTGYTLTATATGPSSGVSNAFNIGSGAVQPYLEEDFSTYTTTPEFWSDPRGIYNKALDNPNLNYYYRGGIISAPTFSRGSTDTRVASGAFDYWLPAGTTVLSRSAVTAGTALPAGTIPQDKWGVFSVQIGAGGTLFVTAVGATFSTGYATEDAARTATTSASWYGTAGRTDLGFVTVQTKTGTTFVAGSDALAGGSSGNVANATNYYPHDVNRVMLDTNISYTVDGTTYTKAMRYDYPDRTTWTLDPTPAYDWHTFRNVSWTVSRGLNFPSVQEVWVEVYAKFGANFKIAPPAAWSYGGGVALKFLEIGGAVSGYWGISLHSASSPIFVQYATHLGVNGGYLYPSAMPWDGNWHRYRWHAKASTNASSADGVSEVWYDNEIHYTLPNINSTNLDGSSAPNLTGLRLGSNINSGPDPAFPLSRWIGRTRVYTTNPGW